MKKHLNRMAGNTFAYKCLTPKRKYMIYIADTFEKKKKKNLLAFYCVHGEFQMNGSVQVLDTFEL